MGSAPASRIAIISNQQIENTENPQVQCTHKKILYTNTLSNDIGFDDAEKHSLADYSISYQKSIKTLSIDLNIRFDTISLVVPLLDSNI